MRSEVLSWGLIHSNINTCLGKHIMMEPWKGRRSDGCMVFKIISFLQIKKVERIKLKSHFFEIFSLQLKKWCWRTKSSNQNDYQNNEYQQGYSPSVSMMRKQFFHSHKWPLWMEEPAPNSQSKRRNQGRLIRLFQS